VITIDGSQAMTILVEPLKFLSPFAFGRRRRGMLKKVLLLDDFLAVAESNDIHVYHRKTLRKWRSILATDQDVVLLALVEGQRVLAIDETGHSSIFAVSEGWRVDAAHPLFTPSATEGGKGRPSQRLLYANVVVGGASATEEQYIVCRSETACWAQTVSGAAKGSFQKPSIDGEIVVVSPTTGAVGMCQKGATWIHFRERVDSQSKKNPMIVDAVAPFQIQSLTLHPTQASVVAVGGIRGELGVSVLDGKANHFFTDHWHHTPLSALQFTSDGSTLLTAGAESTVLFWNMSNYTFSKVSCSIGPIQDMVTESVGCKQMTNEVFVLGKLATVGVINALTRKLERVAEGIRCETGVAESLKKIVPISWKGQPAAMLVGLGETIRIVDSEAGRTVYSLHARYNMEATVSAPNVGIEEAAAIDGGNVICTYENFHSLSLPNTLRFWNFASNLNRHVETQQVTNPHPTTVIALKPLSVRKGFASLSNRILKIWLQKGYESNAMNEGDEEGSEAGDEKSKSDFRFVAAASWASEVGQATCVEFGPEENLAFVAVGSSISILDIGKVSGKLDGTISLIHILSQPNPGPSSPISKLALSPSTRLLACSSTEEVSLWSCTTGELVGSVSPVTAGNAILDVIVSATGDIYTVTVGPSTSTIDRVTVSSNGTIKQTAAHTVAYPVDRCALLSSDGYSQRFMTVSRSKGLRFLTISKEGVAKTSNSDAVETDAAEEAQRSAPRRVDQYFPIREVKRQSDSNDGNQTLDSQRWANAKSLLRESYGDAAFAAPPVTPFLASFLEALS
jgi:NET1-associated nuclear protein 1 (U3 small nucleolar RNA-associated protein 17)